MSTPIIVAYGDTSPEIMDAALHVLREAGAELEIESIQIGERIYSMGSTTGILPSAWECLHRTRILLKAPTLPPEEGKEDVTAVIRDRMGLDASMHHAGELAASYINEHFALFEPLESTPESMLEAALMLLEHTGQAAVKARILATPLPLLLATSHS